MGQRLNDAAAKVAQIKLRKEECVSDMGQRRNRAVTKDAQTMRGKEECAGGMDHTAIQMTDRLHLDHYSNRQLQLNLNRMSMLLKLP